VILWPVSTLKDEQKEVVVHLLRVEGLCYNFADWLWKKSDISTLRNGKRNANGANVVVLIVSPLKSIMKEQIHVKEMEELRISAN